MITVSNKVVFKKLINCSLNCLWKMSGCRTNQIITSTIRPSLFTTFLFSILCEQECYLYSCSFYIFPKPLTKRLPVNFVNRINGFLTLWAILVTSLWWHHILPDPGQIWHAVIYVCVITDLQKELSSLKCWCLSQRCTLCY